MVHIFTGLPSGAERFAFTFTTDPSFKFSFDWPISVPLSHRPFKRRRALSDVDGDGNEGRKKRRLRLHLITSRLSRPFSQPASNIVNRGISKIAVWGAKHKAPGSKHALRKAAIMNRVRMRMDDAKDFMREQEKIKEKVVLREIVIHKPRILLPPPSPLGLSNYDALDLEDELEDESHDGMEKIDSIYSDFNIMNPCTGDGDDYDYLDALDGIMPEDLPDSPPTPPEEAIVEMLREDHREETMAVACC